MYVTEGFGLPVRGVLCRIKLCPYFPEDNWHKQTSLYTITEKQLKAILKLALTNLVLRVMNMLIKIIVNILETRRCFFAKWSNESIVDIRPSIITQWQDFFFQFKNKLWYIFDTNIYRLKINSLLEIIFRQPFSLYKEQKNVLPMYFREI